MPADLVTRDAASPTDPDANLKFRYENTLGASGPLDAVTWLDDGRALADDYELIFDTSAGVKCQVICNSKNPAAEDAEACVADGVTVNKDLIPGLGIVINSAVATGYKAKVSIGDLMADITGVTTSRFVFGVVEVGDTTSQRRIAVTNVGAAGCQETKLYILPGTRFEGTGSLNIIKRITNHSSTTKHKAAPAATKVITFANWADDIPSGKKKVDILVGGNTAVTGALLDGDTVYQFGVPGYDDGNDYLIGLQIMLQDTTDDPTSASISLLVTNGYTWVETAPDVSGSPGTWGTDDIDLTEPGQTAGTITASGTAYYWVRLAMPEAAGVGDMRGANVAPKGLTV